MKPTIADKMEDFLKKANLLLTESKQTNCESKKALTSINRKMNFFIASSLAIIIFILGLVNDTRVEVVKKADASEVVYKQNALYIEKLKITNDERIYAILADTSSNMELIEKYNQNYIWQIESIHDINYRGE